MLKSIMLLLISFIICVTSLSVKKSYSNDTDYLLAIERASSIYTTGSLLDAVEILRIYNDSKTFVDMPMKVDPESILSAWDLLSSSDRSDKTIVTSFLNQHFYDDGSDLISMVPDDIQSSLSWSADIRNASYQAWAEDLNRLWKDLGRQVSSDAMIYPQRYSIIQQMNTFIIPGGRFRENYYWDSYWIVLGLLACDAYETAVGMIYNFLHDIELFGFIPNGGRIYYLDRSQPPVLSEMIISVVLYGINHPSSAASIDEDFIQACITGLDHEYQYWMDEDHHHAIQLDDNVILNRYYADVSSPRPESYMEDMISCQDSDEKSSCYSNIAAAAESGWDFSSRWFAQNDGAYDHDDALASSFQLSSLGTRSILPVDLNSFLLRMEQNIAILYEYQRNPSHIEAILSSATPSTLFVQRQALLRAMSSYTNSYAISYYKQSIQRVQAIQSYLWDDEHHRWSDYMMSSIEKKLPRLDVMNSAQISQYFPIWAGILEYTIDNSSIDQDLVYQSFISSQLMQKYGIQATSMSQNITGQQWDSPNAWPPLQLITVELLLSLNITSASSDANTLLSSWLASNYQGWAEEGLMYEKYNAMLSGERGIGGEYPPQAGFGWSNGVALHMLHDYYTVSRK